jgi:hypothetical protein
VIVFGLPATGTPVDAIDGLTTEPLMRTKLYPSLASPDPSGPVIRETIRLAPVVQFAVGELWDHTKRVRKRVGYGTG